MADEKKEQTIEELRKEVLGYCKALDDIDRAAVTAATALRCKQPVEVTVCPGDGFRHCYLFVPVAACIMHGAAYGMESASLADPEKGVWVCRIDPGGYHSAIYPLVLIGGDRPPHPTYISEHWFPNAKGRLDRDAFILERLLEKIGKYSKER